MLGPINITEIKNLAPLPASVVRLAQIVADPRSDMDEITYVIEFDQALTANVLRWANSAWSQTQTPIDNIPAAIVRLGMETVLKLAVGNHLLGPMSQPNSGYDLSENELWHHSVATALTTEYLREITHKPMPPGAFSAGLLHDIGKLVLGRHMGLKDMKLMIQKQMRYNCMSYVEAERAVMHTDHAEVGAAIAREWKLPEVLSEAIANHHAPDQAAAPLSDVIHVGNAVAKLIGQNLGSEHMYLQVSTAAANRLGLNEDNVQILCAMVKEQLEVTRQTWKL
jgi:putative nucleotidyltransferase with HDIG domain